MITIIEYIIFIILIIALFVKIGHNTIISFKFWFVFAYSFVTISHIISPYHYIDLPYWWIFPYFFICLAMVVVGYEFGLQTKKRKRKKIYISQNVLFAIAILGGIMTAYDFLKNNSIILGMRVEDQYLSAVGTLGVVLSSCGIVVWLQSLYRYKIYGESVSWKAYLSILSYLVFTILSGGRQAFLFALITTFIILVYGQKYRKFNKFRKKQLFVPLPIYGLVVLVALYFSTVSVARSQINDIDNKINMFEGTQTRVDEDFRNYVRDLSAADVIVEGMFYYTHEMPRLYILFKNYDYPPTFGLSQALYLERRLKWLVGDYVDNSWKAEEKALTKDQMDPHTWGTFISAYIMDFGRIGTVLFCFLTGMLYGRLLKYHDDDAFYYVKVALICSGAVFSIQFSPFSELCWVTPLIITSIFKSSNVRAYASFKSNNRNSRI